MSNSSQATPPRRPLLSDRNYSILKHVAAIGLPAAGALYFALAGIWNFPNAEQVVGSIAAVNVFLGGFMGVSQVSYNASDAAGYLGDLNVTHMPDGTKQLQIAANSEASVQALDTGDSVRLNVVRQ